MPLKSPGRIPSQFNRRVSRFTRTVVASRHRKKREKTLSRLKRNFSRLRRKLFPDRAIWMRLGGIALLILILALISAVVFSPILSVREIRITRTSPRLDVEETQKILTSFFGRRLYAVSPLEIEALLRRNLSDIDDVSVGKAYPNTLGVRISLEPLSAQLTIEEPGQEVRETGSGILTTDYLTNEGRYIKTFAAERTAHLLPHMSIVDWGARPIPGTILISPFFLESMRDAEDVIEGQFGQEIIARTVFLRAREFHFTVSGFELWFDLKSPLSSQLDRYRIFLDAVGIGNVSQYVDLRISDRVVYR